MCFILDFYFVIVKVCPISHNLYFLHCEHFCNYLTLNCALYCLFCALYVDNSEPYKACNILDTVANNSDVTCHIDTQMVDGAKHLISCHWLAFLSAFSHLQLIQNSVPSTICWCQCDILIAIRLLNNKFHGLSPFGGHSLLYDQGFPNNVRLQRLLADWNAIWWYFVSMRLYLAMLFILSIVENNQLHRRSSYFVI